MPVESSIQNALSAAMMAGIAFLPIVIAAGFLAEHFETERVPREISTAALRGPMDIDRPATAEAQSAVRVRAGF